MKKEFIVGAQKILTYKIKETDCPDFGEGILHPVCSTFRLAEKIEWATRQFVLEAIDLDEEGIGTLLTVEHLSAALVNEQITIYSSISKIKKNELICSYEVKVGNRTIAKGETGQKVLKRNKLKSIFENLKNESKKK
ncbi:MAG: hypothetical protein AAF363_02670 [Bacteroidota bacterium]